VANTIPRHRFLELHLFDTLIEDADGISAGMFCNVQRGVCFSKKLGWPLMCCTRQKRNSDRCANVYL
jgi:hypothetical protein